MSCLMLNYVANVLTLIRIFSLTALVFFLIVGLMLTIERINRKWYAVLAWIGFVISVLLIIFIPSSSIVLNGCSEMPWFLSLGK